jgi:TPR repeat protein
LLISLLTGGDLQRSLTVSIRSFIQSPEGGNPESQRIVGWMTEKGIGTAIDIAAAARYYELSADHSIAGAFRLGQCCQNSLGVPVDFTVAVEFFQKAADTSNADGANSFGCCLERGEGVDVNIELVVKYYFKGHQSLICPDCTTMGAVLSMALGLNMI